MSEWNKDEHCLAENLIPLVLRHILNCAAVVEPVGEFYQDDAHIVIECQEDSLEVLSLHALSSIIALFLLIFKHILDFGKAVDEGCNLVPEKVPYVFRSECRILHDIVKQGSRNGLAAQANVSDHDSGNCDGMENIGFTRTSADILMSLIGEFKCLLDYLKLIFTGASLAGNLLQVRIAPRNDFVISLCEFRCSHITLSQYCTCLHSGKRRRARHR